MELTDLVGEHTLTGVDTFFNVGADYWHQDASVIRFRLDGVVYVATEDPDDGYRSSLKEIIIQENDRVTNEFPPVKVVGTMKHDILILKNVENGKVVLEVGTDNSDDYYPSFVSYFNPENMQGN